MTDTKGAGRRSAWAVRATAWVYVLLGIGLAVALYIPWPDTLALIPTLIEFLPGWLLLLPGVVLLPLLRTQRHRVLVLATVLLNTVLFLDFELPSLIGRNPEGLQIRIATYNIGNTPVQWEDLMQWYRDSQLDALAIQETQVLRSRPRLPDDMHYLCGGRLCVLTHHRVEKLESLSRQDFEGGWGSYVARFDLHLGGETLALYNVHLNTPRHELEHLRGLAAGVHKAADLYSLRSLESQIASAMVAQHPEQRRHIVIAGDFNLSTRGAIYRKYWSDYTNAFGRAGTGMGYTKRTRLFGARIDHVLVNDAVGVVAARVERSLGGDHSPLVTELSLR